MPKLDFQRVPFPLLGGIETKVSDITLQPPKLTVAENCFAERTGAIRRRKGLVSLSNSTVDNGVIASYQAGATALAVAKYKDSLLAFDNPSSGTGVYEYSESASRWTEHGNYAPGVINSESIAAATGGTGIWQADVDVSGGYTLFAFIEDGLDDSGAFNSTIRVTLRDALGAFVCHRLQVFTDGSGASLAEKMNLRVVALGSRFYVFFGDRTNHDIRVWILDTSTPATITSAIGTSGGGSAAASVLVASDLHTDMAGIFAVFDVAPSSINGVFLCYRTTTANQLKLGFVSTTGVLASTTTLATVANAFMVSVAVAPGSTSRHGITYCVGTTPNDIYAFHMSWSGAAWSTTATSAALETAGATSATGMIACKYDSLTVLRIWYSSDATYQATYTTAGVGASRVVRLRRAQLASRPFAATNSVLYFWCQVGGGSKERTHFLVESATGLPVGYASHGVAEGGGLSSVATDSDGGFVVALLYITRAVNGVLAFASGAVNLGVRAVKYFLNHGQSHRMVEVADSVLLAGSLMQQFDGVNFVELGFLRTVDMNTVTLTPAAGGSIIGGGLYYFRVIEEWTNARGKRELGTDFGPKSVTLAAGDHQVTLVIPTNTMTRRRRTNQVTANAQTARSTSVFGVYRSAKNPATSKTAFTRVGEVANDPTADTVTFVDQLADATALTNEGLYLANGIVDHTTPPAGHVMCEGMGRVFVAADPEHPFTVYYSLEREPDEPVAFSDALTIVLPDNGGDIVAMAVMNEALVIFKERAIYRVRGSGFDNTGQNGGFFDPELVVNDIGCEGQRSVVVGPFGVMFKSARGFQLLTPGYEVEYIGAPLEGLVGNDNPNASPINGSVLLPMEQQVRFTGTRTWIYDYWHKQWFVYTENENAAGPSVEFEGKYTYPGSPAIQYEDDSAVFTGTMRLVLALLRGSTAQDDLHVRYFGVSGYAANVAVDIRVKAYPDLTTVTPAQTEESLAMAPGPVLEQWRTVDDTRVVSTLRLEIDDKGSGSGGGILSLNEVVFEMAPRSSGLTARLGR